MLKETLTWILNILSIKEAIIQSQKYAFLPYVNKQAVLRGQEVPQNTV